MGGWDGVTLVPASGPAGRVGDKGVISRIIPDDQMPVAADGKPVEVLMNPLGTALGCRLPMAARQTL